MKKYVYTQYMHQFTKFNLLTKDTRDEAKMLRDGDFFFGATTDVGDNVRKYVEETPTSVKETLKDVKQCRENYKGTLGNVVKTPRDIGFF
jgi:hypothetical protein